MRVGMCVVVALLVPANVFGSDSGEPLDCSDWVILEPGLTCETHIPYPCKDANNDDSRCGSPSLNRPMDNEGKSIYLKRFVIDQCGEAGSSVFRREILSLQGETETLLAYFEDRCQDPFLDYVDNFGLNFDRVNGRLFVTFANIGAEIDGPGHPYEYGRQRVSLSGFTTLFDVLQTFTTVSALGFHVPYMPEGMNGADWFDTYWGDLATVGDWSQASGLQCAYPSTTPKVGDYLAVTDTLPTPEPGSGYYYVTAAAYQGATRYGRKASGGELRGRDPAVLPECQE